MEKELYQWQEDCLKQWFANNSRGIVQAVTGSGKTFLALTAVTQLENHLKQPLRIKIVVPTSSLMWQWNRSLREFLTTSDENSLSLENINQKIGLRGGGCKSSLNCKYMIYVINSARYELARQILAEIKNGESVLLIADECHHYASGQNQLIFEFLPHIKQYESQFFSLGLTATLPSGQELHDLTASLGRKIYTYGMAKAAALQTVCQYDIFHIELSFEKSEQSEYDEISEQMLLIYSKLVHRYPYLADMDIKERYTLIHRLCGNKNQSTAKMASRYMRLTYARTNLICLASARITCACTLIQLLTEQLPQRDRILIFGERISQADRLYQLLQSQYHGKVGRYHSKMGSQANKNALERFRTGDIRILIACKSIDEGIDVPDASIGIVLSGTSTKRQRVQRLGRIIRKNEGKNRALLYYLHLSGTSEETFFLPDSKDSRSFDLTFIAETQTFDHPDYDKAAHKLLRKMWHAGIKKDQLREAKRCLLAGCIRADWLLERREIENHIQNAKYNHEKNYWICMKKLAEMNLKEL